MQDNSQQSETNGCSLHITAFDGNSFNRTDSSAFPDLFLSFCFKGNRRSEVKTEVQDSTVNPVWNQELHMSSHNYSTDILTVDLLDEDIKCNDKMMNTLEIPLKEHPIGSHYVFDEDVKLKQKNAGHLHFEIDFQPLTEV